MTPLPGRLVLLGHPVSHSKSPAFQNAALAAAGIPLRYEALDVAPAEFSNLITRLRAERAAGNVTVPHKARMHDQCDEVSPLAERVGAVNTFWVDANDQLVGDNTDVGGFTSAVISLLGAPPRNIDVGLIGAGGSAAAVVAAVESWPRCTIRVFNRTPGRARELCARFRSVAQPVDDIRDAACAHLVVNATTVGLRDDDMPVDPSLVPSTTAAMDLVYKKGGTAWVRALEARGCAAADGSAMLIEQGAIAFERWFGIAPDRSVMWEAFRRE